MRRSLDPDDNVVNTRCKNMSEQRFARDFDASVEMARRQDSAGKPTKSTEIRWNTLSRRES